MILPASGKLHTYIVDITYTLGRTLLYTHELESASKKTINWPLCIGHGNSAVADHDHAFSKIAIIRS